MHALVVVLLEYFGALHSGVWELGFGGLENLKFVYIWRGVDDCERSVMIAGSL